VPGELFEHAVPHPVLQLAVAQSASAGLHPGENAILRRRDRKELGHVASSP
jgi:hypothetical protein